MQQISCFRRAVRLDGPFKREHVPIRGSEEKPLLHVSCRPGSFFGNALPGFEQPYGSKQLRPGTSALHAVEKHSG